MRRRVARGTLINGAFLVGVNLLNIMRGLLVVGFLTASDYGLWGIVYVTLSLLLAMRAQGVTDRFVQQREDDQVLAFQRALTVELAFACVLLAIAIIAAPVLALAYGDGALLAPALVAATAIPGLALQVPLAVFYREMQFGRQRLLQSIDPVVSTVATLTLAASGAGYWALVAGLVIGAWTGALVALIACPYPLRLAYDRAAIRDYVTFSWPLVFSGAAGAIMGQAILFTGDATLGLAGAGAITLSYTVSQYANRLDQAIASTIYPAICAARNRADVLFETFVKSNRLAVLWGAPFGIGLALFAPDLVRFALGPSWQPATHLLQATGIMAAIHQVAFNWDAFYRARADTRPIAVASVIGIVCFFTLCVPGLAVWGLDGLAAAFLAFEAVGLVVRLVYTRRLFAEFHPLSHAVRGFRPACIALGVVLLARVVDEGVRTEATAAVEAVIFAVLVLSSTLLLERRLVREIVGYIRRPRGNGPEGPPLAPTVGGVA